MRKVFKCLAVDDNPAALKLITNLINRSANLSLIHESTNPVETLKLIEEKTIIPDFIFLDLEMRRMHGTHFAERVKGGPMLIFTTAHRDFGPESHELGTVGYLLKPIEEEKFTQAVAIAIERWDNAQRLKQMERPEKILIPGSGKTKKIQIPTESIIYGKASRNYTDVFMTNDKKHMTFLTVKKFEQLLPSPWFVRINRSHIINIDQIKEVDALRITLNNDVVLTIGTTYKAKVTELLKSRFMS